MVQISLLLPVKSNDKHSSFLAHLSVKNTTLDFVLGVIHTKPAAAEEEISALIDVFNWSTEYYEDQKNINCLNHAD